ncbi:MAG: thiol:disulfide interchange protein [Candidatus Brocadia fulgida]|uniref:Thiol:disulfide interchange protein n=1 Tax=Candidatus Brocadia fulgida TaxID=380242 RepID=A0A0M2UYX1_9BACT|nr:MAG: thiol:disulfide interchange protein [Candidatus Brocadia fulgida]
MRTKSLRRGFFIIVCILLLIPQIIFGETSPFSVKVSLLKDHVPAGDLIPVTVSLMIAPNHRVYKDQVKVESGDPSRFTIVSTELPAGKIKYDQFLEKEVENYEGQLEIKSFVQIPKDTPTGLQEIKLKVHYQGCSDKFCFLPKVEEFLMSVQVEPAGWGMPVSQTEVKQPQAALKSEKKAEITGLQKTIESRGIFISLALIFLAGVGLSFTPCVYPMIPITVAVIGGKAAGEQASARKPLSAFFLSLVYVLGISIVYSAMGVAAASTGALFGSALQSPWVIGFVVVVFVGLALSMFGVYYLRVPSLISDRLGTETGTGFIGVFVMGLISGIVASPCIGPALASLLVYIASTGNKFLGFWMLFVFAWGLGVLLIVLGTFSGVIKALPKSGGWMETVERIFGLLLIGVALYYLRFIISEGAFIMSLGLFLIVTGVFSGGFDRLTHESTVFQRAKRAFGLIVFIFGVYFLVGHLMIRGFILPPFSTATPGQSVEMREKIDWVYDEEEGLRQAGRRVK